MALLHGLLGIVVLLVPAIALGVVGKILLDRIGGRVRETPQQSVEAQAHGQATRSAAGGFGPLG